MFKVAAASKHFQPAFFLLFLGLVPAPLFAVETVKSPLVTEGQLEFENKGKLQYDRNPGRDDEKEFDLTAAYGFTPHWKSKIEGEFEQKRGNDFHYKNFLWENILNLNGTDVQHETVLALFESIIFADRTDSSHAFAVGVLARRDFSKLANTFNLFFKRDFGDTAKNGVSVQPRWQTKYALLPYLAPGFEVIGDTQKKDAPRNWNLIIGPMLYGDLSFAGLKGVSFEIGTLFGATPGSHDVTLKWGIKYGIAY